MQDFSASGQETVVNGKPGSTSGGVERDFIRSAALGGSKAKKFPLKPCSWLAKNRQPSSSGQLFIPWHIREGFQSLGAENGHQGVTVDDGVVRFARQNSAASREAGSGWVLSDDLKNQLRNLFQKMDADKNGLISVEEKQNMQEQIRMLLIQFGIGGGLFKGMPTEVNLEGFERWFVREWELAMKVQALADADVVRALAENLPGGKPDFPLAGLRMIPPEELSRLCRGGIAKSIENLLVEKRNVLVGLMDQVSARQSQDVCDGNSKFATGGAKMAKFGSIDDFHKGIAGQIGLPNPDFLVGMETEHNQRQDSKDEFKPGNYDTTTTPEQEWKIATDPTEGAKVSTDTRIVKPLEELMKLENVGKANLRKEEVLGLVLYTGPMFYKYNTVLRDYADERKDQLKGNKYVTTIYCIISGIIKLSEIMEMPDDRRVYRGLSGLELPENFTKPDEFGIRGGAELAMLSTTLERSVAIQYSTVGDKLPTLFEINLGAIDRGASISFLSQYPKENEILLPPRSYLEVVGGASRMEAGEDGRMIRVISLKVNANAMSSKIEVIESRRQEIFLSAGEASVLDIKWSLEGLKNSPKVQDFLKMHPYDSQIKVNVDLSTKIGEEVQEWLQKYKGKNAAFFNDEWQFSRAMQELSVLQRMATGKFQYWLNGDKDIIPKVLIKEPMEQVARRAESNLRRRLDELLSSIATSGQVADVCEATAEEISRVSSANTEAGKLMKKLAHELCRCRGLIINDVDQESLGEKPIVASASRGEIQNLEPLLLAGCTIDDANSKDRSTALHRACMMGHLEYVRRLIEKGADIHKTDLEGKTGLRIAAELGHAGVVQLLLDSGGWELAKIKDQGGDSCAHAASRRAGGEKLLRSMVEKCGIEILNLNKENGSTCAHLAAMNGNLEIVKYLKEVAGVKYLEKLDDDGKSTAFMASYNGKLDVLKYINEVCGKDLLLKPDKKGQDCASVAANEEISEYLLQECGKGNV